MQDVYFYQLGEIRDVIDQLKASGQPIDKYVPTPDQLSRFVKFAEQFTYPGIILWYPNQQAKIISSSAYDYREGSVELVFSVFNAELALDGDEDEPAEYLLSLWFEPNQIVQVPIRHAFMKHIFWQSEYSEIVDYLKIANKQMKEYRKYLRKRIEEELAEELDEYDGDDFDDDFDDDDDDDAKIFHY